TASFGDRPAIYYMVRTLYFGIFLGSLIWLATPTLGTIVSTSVTILCAVQVFWAHIWTYSFGVVEQVAVLGLGIAVVGYGHVITDWVHQNSRGSRGIVSVSIGTAIAIGCKENFLFLLLPLSVTLIAFRHRRLLTLGDLVKTLPILVLSTLCGIRI